MATKYWNGTKYVIPKTKIRDSKGNWIEIGGKESLYQTSEEITLAKSLYTKSGKSSYNSTNGATIPSNIFYAQNFTINTGHTVYTAKGDNIIYVHGNCIINGTFQGSGRGMGTSLSGEIAIPAFIVKNNKFSMYLPSLSTSAAPKSEITRSAGRYMNDPGGNGGNCTIFNHRAAGGNGGDTYYYTSEGAVHYGGGGGGERGSSSCGGDGGGKARAYTSPATYSSQYSYPTRGASGGNSASSITLIVKGNVTIGSSGKILANGNNGGNCPIKHMEDRNGRIICGTGGGGGGGGARIAVIYGGSFTNHGTIQHNGGLGGSGDEGGRGGNGGAGIFFCKKGFFNY